MAVASLGARGLLLSLHLQQACKFTSGDKFFAALRIQSTKNFPRAGGAVFRTSRVPHCLSLKESPADSSPSSDAVILSSKECPDGSILFKFGSSEQSFSEDATETSENNDNGAVAESACHSEHAAEESVSNASITEVPERRTDIGIPSNGYPVQDASSDMQNSTTVSTGEAPLSTADGPANEVKKEGDDTSVVPTVEDVSLELDKGVVEKEEQKLRSGAAMRPHPSKAASGGEDAYLIEGTNWIGVADGVGGWGPSGIDAGLYSRELMTNCVKLARLENGVPDPKGVIIKSVQQTRAAGTSTAVLGALHKQTLYVANIGDSGFLVVRNGKTLAKSNPMQRGFNFPYQIGGVSEGDDPSLAQTYEVSVSTGDAVVLATDGLFDNLYEREIVDVVHAGQKKAVKPQEVAMWLVKLAHSMGIEAQGRSPFADAAMAAGYSYYGGKLDDVTVVVSYIE